MGGTLSQFIGGIFFCSKPFPGIQKGVGVPELFTFFQECGALVKFSIARSSGLE